MTERELEQRLRAWFEAEVGSDRPSLDLGSRIAAIPELHRPSVAWWPWRGRRRSLAVLLAALLLVSALVGSALMVGSGLLRLPWVVERVPPDPASFAVCDLLRVAIRQPDASGIDSPYKFDGEAHGVLPAADADACVYGWDDSFSKPHLVFRTQRTSAAQAVGLLPTLFDDPNEETVPPTVAWRLIRPGMWAGVGTEEPPRPSFGAAVVSDEPYFFLLTAADDDDALAGAERILAELRDAGDE